MKRFLICAVAGLFLVVGAIYLFLVRGFYVDLRPDQPMEVPFSTRGKEILVKQNGTYLPLELKGVEVSAGLPGEYASSFAAKTEDYLRWLELIGEMGANLVRVYTIMDDDFYNAFYHYNTTHEQPLYLLQGLQIAESANNGAESAFSDAFMGSLIRDGKAAVDMIHGRKITLEGASGRGYYWKDVSPWVLGYLVGQSWNGDTIAYTDHGLTNPSGYTGTYFATTQEAGCFETMLAQVMDTIMAYESEKYHTQRLIGFNSAPETDFLEYEEVYARQLGKYAHLDAEHICPRETVRSGYFAAYNLSKLCNDFSEYLSREQKTRLSGLLETMDTSCDYDGYLDLVGSYHTMPVIAAGYGVSSARGAITGGEQPRTERQQGEQLVKIWEDARTSGWAGVCISTWQDAWERIAWNTAFATDLGQNFLWHDLQTDGEHYGLMAFVPGTNAVYVVNGVEEDLSEDTPAVTAEDMQMYLRYDQEGLYIYIRGYGANEERPLYVPIDLTDDLGSGRCLEPALSFDRMADFVLCIDGRENTRLLVQERYDALRGNFNRELGREDPFLSWPEADSPRFVPVGMALGNTTMVEAPELLSADQLRQLRALGVWEAGRLVHGNGDPGAENYNSLADFCFGENCVEIRLPWTLLNVADPTEMRVHDDYYTHYGVHTTGIDTFWIGLGSGDEEIRLAPVDVRGWDWELTWRERLKESYYIVQSNWKK